MTRFRDHKYDTSGYVTLNDGVRRTDNASMTKREKALVEALREGERIEGGIHQYTPQAIRWALKVSKCLAAYDEDEPCFGRDITMENAHE